MDWRDRHASSRASAKDAVARIPRGKHIFVGSGAAQPTSLVDEMVRQYTRFADNQIVHILTLGPAPYVEPPYQDRFRHNAFFIGPNVREAVHEGRADYTPVFLSQIPELMRRRRIPIDVALVQVTPPDRFGFVNLGVAVDVVLPAIETASLVIAEVNPRMPVVHGAGFLPMDRLDAWVEVDAEIPVVEREELDDVSLEIGRHVATLVEDGATVQVGIGQIPDAVATALHDKKDLGVWTEMLSDGLVDLVENGNVTGRYKTIQPNKVTASFTFGTKKTYDFVDGNPAFSFHPSDFVNDPSRIAQQHKMVAINSALQIDLTGQVCSDSIGTKFYSGIGGQVDFIRGASMAPSGKPVLAIRSTALGGSVSKIVATLDEGAGVVTSRGDVQFVVTEYGIADLQGKSIRERAMSLISIAHPDFRSDLLATAKERHYVFADQIEPRATYATRYEKLIQSRGGEELRLRPVRETDEGKMRDLFYNFSADTVYKRWMTAMSRLPHSQLQRYLRVDDTENVAMVVERTASGRDDELIGIGRYHTDAATRFAEVALAIRDDYQGQGVGTALFGHLADIARENDIRGFTAEVLSNNRAMLDVFHKSGLNVETRREGTTYSLRMPFSNAESSKERSHATDDG